MFVIQNNQLEVFKGLALKRFEDEMVVHVQAFYPNHFLMMQEIGIRNTIRYAYLKAKNYGFTTKRNVCLYLNTMLVLGSNFDEDPQYPWAEYILNNESGHSPVFRIDKLSDKALEVFYQISGRQHVYLNRALYNLHRQADEIFQSLRQSDLKSIPHHLNAIFPEKHAVIGEFTLQQMIKYGVAKATHYGITSESNLLMYVVFMFMMGSGFDRDPQFAWAGEILNDLTVSDQDKKVEMLYHQAITTLRNFLSQYNHQ